MKTKTLLAGAATILSVFVTDLAAYNAGTLRGEWLDLPCASETLNECIDRVTLGRDHEIFITDYESESNINVDEFENLHELNKKLAAFADLDEYQQEIAAAILGTGNYSDLEEVVGMVDNCVLYSDCETLEDLAYQLIEEGAFGDIPESIRNYIDYGAIARDLNYDNYCETSRGVLYIG